MPISKKLIASYVGVFVILLSAYVVFKMTKVSSESPPRLEVVAPSSIKTIDPVSRTNIQASVVPSVNVPDQGTVSQTKKSNQVSSLFTRLSFHTQYTLYVHVYLLQYNAKIVCTFIDILSDFLMYINSVEFQPLHNRGRIWGHYIYIYM